MHGTIISENHDALSFQQECGNYTFPRFNIFFTVIVNFFFTYSLNFFAMYPEIEVSEINEIVETPRRALVGWLLGLERYLIRCI